MRENGDLKSFYFTHFYHHTFSNYFFKPGKNCNYKNFAFLFPKKMWFAPPNTVGPNDYY